MTVTTLMSITDPTTLVGLPELISSCVAVDTHSPFEEHTLLTLDGVQQRPHAVLGADHEGVLVSCAVLSEGVNGWSLEAAVHPSHRGRGLGTQLIAGALQHIRSHGGGPLRAWVHGASAPANALASRFGARTERQLLVLERPLTADLPSTRCPEGVDVRRLDPTDDAHRQAWLTVSNAAFLGHPDNGGWTRADLDWRMSAAWTDGSRFPVAHDALGPAAGVWTKRDPGSPDGELYVVAVHPRAQGRGLGRLVVTRALDDLRADGCHRALLYVEADNQPARRLYDWAGFTPGTEHACLLVTVPSAAHR